LETFSFFPFMIFFKYSSIFESVDLSHSENTTTHPSVFFNYWL
jgi:hypothetical protein